jgi:hypothetical protein
MNTARSTDGFWGGYVEDTTTYWKRDNQVPQSGEQRRRRFYASSDDPAKKAVPVGSAFLIEIVDDIKRVNKANTKPGPDRCRVLGTRADDRRDRGIYQTCLA